ncbi:Ribonuclease T2-like [Tilletia horrida]|uniref:ribonuclease T2 n=1 Tax=Tilletia horrida TaxID=155126 RepID=A0AAN6JS89_9BASI|nr:Ribonuclease T2-like [Tilletia horrida]
MLFDVRAITAFWSSLSLTLLGQPLAPASSSSASLLKVQEDCISCSLILLTQFWDSHPAAGPDDSWTIHGLWPDYCNGSYPANCDPSRASLQPLQVLRDAGEVDLISYMNEFWVSNMGSTPNFWSHEWSKHGVCVSTLDPKCYSPSEYTPHRDLIDFFNTTTSLHARYNIYQALAKADILPTASKTYAVADIKAALKKEFGVNVALRCRSVYLQEAWIYHHTVGRATSPDSFIPIDGLAKDDRCPQNIRYMPK